MCCLRAAATSAFPTYGRGELSFLTFSIPNDFPFLCTVRTYVGHFPFSPPHSCHSGHSDRSGWRAAPIAWTWNTWKAAMTSRAGHRAGRGVFVYNWPLLGLFSLHEAFGRDLLGAMNCSHWQHYTKQLQTLMLYFNFNKNWPFCCFWMQAY